MPRIDLLDQSATRVELDQRSREARLRLEHVERLLVVRPMPRQSLLRRVLGHLGSRISVGGRVEGRSAEPALTGGRSRQRSSGEAGGAGGSSATPPACHRSTPISPLPRGRLSAHRDFDPWAHWCGRGDLNSHVLSDNRF